MTVFLFSCKSDEDKNNPEIIIQNIEWGSGSFNEQDTLVVQAGEQITLSALLQDDQELNSFKLELDAVSIDEIHQDETSWSERRIKSLSGTSEVFESILNTPIQADGFFTLDLNLIDDQGNSATPVDYIINVENIEFPTIQIDSLNGLVPTNTIQLLQGETLIIKGNASDNTNFEELSLNWLFGDVIFTSNV
ncbi:MAG: DUF4625 domain-containing protein, partial [Flavobacteriales bacterium]